MMKLPLISSPWTLVKWGVVILIYGLTVGIALDQINERDSKIASQKARVDELESKLPQLTRAINKIQAENHAAIQMFEEEKAKLENRIKLQESIEKASEAIAEFQKSQSEESPKESLSLQENAKRQIQARKELLESMGVEQNNQPSYQPSTSARGAADPIKPWIPPTQSASVKIIKDRAIAKWKDDYSMVNYSIRSETEALQKLLQYNKNPSPVVKTLLAKAAQKWPEDYSMMVYSVESQLEAKQKLDGR